jgi:hypothetical protein
MSKWVSSAVLDGALAVVSQATRMVALGAQPADYAEAVAGSLAEVTLAPGDFSVGPGVTSGRRVAIAAKSGVSVAAPGVASHVALIDPVLERLLYVTTCPAQALPAGGTVNFDSWAVEIGDPV